MSDTNDGARIRTASPFAAFDLGPQLSSVAVRLTVVLLLCAMLTMVSSSFLTTPNLLNVLRQASLIFLVAAGLTLVILTGGIDLSVGSTLSLAACLTAGVMKATGSPALGICTGLVVGIGVGLANGAMVAILKVPPFIATYGMLWVAQGLAYAYMQGDILHGFPPEFRFLGGGFFLGIPVPVYMMAVVLAAGAVFASRTNWGKDFYLIGANRTAAFLSGTPVRNRLLLVYALSGLTAGLAGVIYVARVNSAEAAIGEPLLLPVLAAVLIGGTSLFGGSGGLLGTAIGALILTLIINGMNLLQVKATWHPFVTGAILVIAVLIDQIMRERARRRA